MCCVHGKSGRMSELTQVIAHVQAHHKETSAFLHHAAKIIRGAARIGHTMPATFAQAAPRPPLGMLNALEGLKASRAIITLQDVIPCMGMSGLPVGITGLEDHARNLSQRVAQDNVRIDPFGKSSLLQIGQHDAMCITCQWETRSGARVAAAMDICAVVGCKKHSKGTDNICWQFKPNSVKTHQISWLLQQGFKPMPLSLRTQRDADITQSFGKACYMQVVALPSHVSPASEIMHSFPALALDALLEEGSILGFHEAKLLSKLFQRRLLWYRDARDKSLDPASLHCPRCQHTCELKNVSEWRKMGVGTCGLFRPCVPTIGCTNTTCSWQISVVDPGFLALVPADYKMTFPWDRFHDRVVEQDVTDWLCAELRCRFHKNGLRLMLARRSLGHFVYDWPVCEVARSMRFHAFLYAHILHGLPRARELCNIPIKVFQVMERPAVPYQHVIICALSAWAAKFDGSSAPLHEARACGVKTKNDFRCALAVHGAFDVPLIQYVYVFEEKVLHEAIIFAYITYCQRKTHPLARPLGWEDDCTERTFAKSGNAIEQVLHTEVVEGSVLVSREQHSIQGFYRGIDLKHVHRRLQKVARGGC